MLDGRLELTVPPGALSSDIILSAQPITNTAFGGLGTAYRLEPDGTTFAKPVTLMFKAGAEDLGKVSIEGMGMAFQDAEGYWNRLPGPPSMQRQKPCRSRLIISPITHPLP